MATTYTYGVLDEVLEVRRGVTTLDESVERFTYDPNLNVTEHLGPDGQRSLFTFDPRSLLLTRTDGAGTAEAVTTQRSYDAEGQVTALQDGLGRSWTRGYDGYGRPQEQRDPLAQGERSEYDDGGLLLKRQRLAGSDVLAETRMEYDALGRATVETALLWEGTTPQSPTALERRFEYDPASNRTAVVDRLGRRSTAHYDAAERLIRTVDAAGNEIERGLDRAGSAIETTTREVTPAGGVEVVVERQSFDALGRLASQSDALGNATAYAYGPRGNLRSTTDPAGFVTFRDYDSLDRLREILQPEGVRQVFGYDASSRKVTYSDGLGQETRWTYDALGRVTGVTYPDQQSVSYGYDPNHNLTQITDQNGTVLAQTYDLANRLTGRTATLAAGLTGPTTETFSWDGLSRLTSATSGAASTALSYNSLSRLIREESGGHAVAYRYDAAGNPQEMTYPSGQKVQRAFDALDRLSGVERPTGDPAAPLETLAAYAYRGPYLLAEMDLGNGVEATWEFDELRRPTRSRMKSPSGHAVFDEVMHWSPRSLKAASDRLDLGGAGKQRAYDGAGRLREEAILGKATQASPNNQRRTPAELQGKETGESFVYDPAQSLLSRKEKASGIETPQALPLDGSGRNRPAEVNGKPLEWDANGNLVRKGDQRFVYDFRNRLTRVTDLDGTEIATYEYDALNRRLAKTVDGVRTQTAWGGWSELETYENGLLTRRHALGRGLDDRVHIEVDQTGDGQPDQVYIPIYDDIGNLVVLTDEAGKPIERYDYDAYGERTITVDLEPPAVTQIRLQGDGLLVELSEAPWAEGLIAGADSGLVTLTPVATGQPLPITVDSDNLDGLAAGQRMRLDVDPSAQPAAGDSLELRIEPEALRDPFGNQPAEAIVIGLSWPASETVLHDSAAPEVRQILVRDRRLSVEFSEPVEPTTAAAHIQVDGGQLAWQADETGYQLRATAPLADGNHELRIGGGLPDLSGRTLGQTATYDFSVSTAEESFFVQRYQDPREVEASTTGNAFGFHGRPEDEETGFLYFRNRYVDPEIGRFVTTDPLGHVDGPSVYALAGNDPVNYGDPLGLYKGDADEVKAAQAAERRRKEAERQAQLEARNADLREFLGSQTGGLSRDERARLLAAYIQEKGYARRHADRVALAQEFLGQAGCTDTVLCHMDMQGKAWGAAEWIVVQSALLMLPEMVLGELLGGGGSYAGMLDDIRFAPRAAVGPPRTVARPSEINYSQRTVSANVRQYADDMLSGNWDWDRSGPIRVMKRDGQLVSYDNRRLMAAQKAGLKEIPIEVVKPQNTMPGSKTTWERAFQRRFSDPRNVRVGGVVPSTGLKTQPAVVSPRRRP